MKRKVILNLAISLDGFIEDENGKFDWCFTDQDYGMKDFLESIDTVFIGRKSFEISKMYEPIPFKDKSVYLFTHQKGNYHENVKVVSNIFFDEINNLKDQEGKDIWLFGGADLINQFLEKGLIDELQLSVHPVILGNGKKITYDLTGRITLELLETKRYSTGLVQLFYKVIPK